MRLSEFNISETVDRAIAEHIKRGVPFTECMFRPGSEAFTMFYRGVREMRESIDMDWFDSEMLDTDIGECVEIDGEVVPLDVPIEDLTEDKKTWFKDGVEMCSKDCCGAPVTECTCGPDCEHCDCYKLKEAQFDTSGLELVKKQDGIELWKSLTDPNEVVAKLPADEMSSKTVWDGYWDGSQWEFASRSGRHGVFYIDQLDELFESLKEAEYQGRKVKLNSPKRGGSKKYYVYTKNKKGNVIKVSWGDTTGLSTKAKNPGAVKSFVARHQCHKKNDKTKAGYWACRTPRYKSLGVKGGQWW